MISVPCVLKCHAVSISGSPASPLSIHGPIAVKAIEVKRSNRSQASTNVCNPDDLGNPRLAPGDDRSGGNHVSPWWRTLASRDSGRRRMHAAHDKGRKSGQGTSKISPTTHTRSQCRRPARFEKVRTGDDLNIGPHFDQIRTLVPVRFLLQMCWFCEQVRLPSSRILSRRCQIISRSVFTPLEG